MEIDKIYNQDCLCGIKQLEDNCINVVLTSPPYNIIRKNCNDRGYDLYNDGMSNEEYSKWTCDIFNELDRVLVKNGCVLWNMSYGSENVECMNLTIADIIRNTNFTIADIIVWKKSSAFPNNMSHNKLTRIIEFIYVLCRKSEFKTFNANKKVTSVRPNGQRMYENIFNFITAKNNDLTTELNKATYSTELCDKLLNIYAKKGDLILDPFIGTGTTAVSCIKNNLHYIGFEISDKQVKFAANRINNAISEE